MLPAQLAIIHCPGHQKGASAVAVGNRQADTAARGAALGEGPIETLVTKEIESGEAAERGEDKQELARKYLQQVHQFTHLGVQKLQNLLREQPVFLISNA